MKSKGDHFHALVMQNSDSKESESTSEIILEIPAEEVFQLDPAAVPQYDPTTQQNMYVSPVQAAVTEPSELVIGTHRPTLYPTR